MNVVVPQAENLRKMVLSSGRSWVLYWVCYQLSIRVLLLDTLCFLLFTVTILCKAPQAENLWAKGRNKSKGTVLYGFSR